MSGESAGDGPPAEDPLEVERVIGESRWPMAAAVLAAIVLTMLLPKDFRLGPSWLLPVIEGLLLLVVVAADPDEITKRSRLLRTLSIVLVTVLVVDALWATAQLISDLISGGPETNSAGDLLAAGSTVWVSNNIAFALLYWELDGGGAAARAHGLPRHPDLAFPQQLNPHVAPPHWRPRFIDYLYVGFTNATAFSPTRRHASGSVGQDRHGASGNHLARHPRPGRGPGRQRPGVGTA